MKIKYNIPMINNLKKKVSNIKDKMKSSKQEKKVPIRYYGLLGLMLLLGIVTLTANVKRYNKTKKESYIKYELSNKAQEETQKVNSNRIYLSAESSIYTHEPSGNDATETISSNIINSYISPIKGDVIKEFAADKLVYSKTLDMWKTHPGIDIKANIGEEVIAVCDGKVMQVTNDNFYGQTIKILEDTGLTFVYSNLDKAIDLKEGDEVVKEQVIGYIGVSAGGEIADESHLHFEIIRDDTQINPLDLIEIQE